MKKLLVFFLLSIAFAANSVHATTYIATAANGLGIPAPTELATYAVIDGTNTVQVPEGMVYVPAGSFTYSTGTTATTMSLDGFCIGRFEVTNAEYKAFLDATNSRSYPSYWSGGTYPAGKANHPLLYVSLTQANAYAAWVSQQTGWQVVVPTAYQWEKAARGPNAYLYPWGNTFTATYGGGVLTAKSNYNANVTSFYLTSHGSDPAIYNNASSTHYNQTVTVGTIAAYSTADVATPLAVSATGAVTGYVDHNTYTGFIYTDVFAAMNAAGGYTTPVGSYASGVSAYGAYDVAGNAYEWTTTTFIASNGAEAGQLVNQVRGGGWYSNGTSGTTIDTGEGRSAGTGYNSVGFRIAMIPVVTTAPLVISTGASLPAGVLNGSYAQTFAATGGSGVGYIWNLTAGALPPGLSLSTAGVLGGAPTTAGTFSFTIRLVDSAAAAVTKTFALTVAAYGAVDHFAWDYVPTNANANAPFAVRVTARDAAGNVVGNFSGSVNLTAMTGSGNSSLSPIVITETAPGNEAQIELQNVSGATVNTSGWFLRVGDSATNSVAGLNTPNATTFNLPATLTAGQLLRITESSTNTAGGRVYFGAAIGWTNTPTTRRGWVALFDATSKLRDFFAYGWTATDLASFAITVNGQAVTLGSQWNGAGATSSGSVIGQNYDSFQRTGASDANSATGWSWFHNADNSDATTLGATNAALVIPWADTGGGALAVSPSTATLVNGEFLGYVTLSGGGSGAKLSADDGAAHTGVTAAGTDIGAALVSTAGDGIDDAWKTANGFGTAANVAALDTDGDGVSNYAEYLAGTNPRSASSAMKVSSYGVPAAGQFSLTWPAVAGKLYRVTTSPDLATWTQLVRVLPTTSGAQTVTLDQGSVTRLFVRVEIVPAP